MSEHSGHDRPEGTEPQARFDFSSPASADPDRTGVRMEVDEFDIGWILFDAPDKPVNTLTTAMMEHLRELLGDAVRRRVRGLVFASDKPDMFIAGADVDEIAGITDPGAGMEKAAYGQAVFETVSRFPGPTVALITGPCLGGGFELSLACTYRIAEDTAAVRVGLPEVKLGIVPGFGGTQRLPRRAGIRVALDVILAGKTLPVRPALRRGMLDLRVPPGMGRDVAREIVTGERRIRAHEPARIDRLLVAIPWTRNFVLDRARKALAAKVRREHYPAPFLAVEAIAAGFTQTEVAAYRNEARLLGETIVSPTSKSLTWLFRNSSRAKEPAGLDLGLGRKVRRMAVAGAGVMGGGVAWLAGEKGIPIRIKDIAPEALEGAMKTAGGIWSRNVRKRRMTPRERDRKLEQLSFTLDYSGFGRIDFVVEAVVENLEVKHKVIAELESVLPSDAVIASNTSSLRIGDLAQGARGPERIVGLHFFNPVHRMPLVEVIAGPASTSRSVATAYRLALDLGKTPILVQDGPGFLVNRLLAFYLGEALCLFEKGLDIVDADARMVEFGMPMGPFELLDQIGIDVAEKVTHVMAAAFGDRLPSQATLTRLAAEGHLGRKSGRGFYIYTGDRKQGPSPEAPAAAGNPAPRAVPPQDLIDFLVLPMINEAARCLEEGVVRRPLDVDLGMVMGTGFPPFRGGLLRYADGRGSPAVVERLARFGDGVAGRFAPSEALRARSGGFYGG